MESAHSLLVDPLRNLRVMNGVKDQFYAEVDYERLENELNIPILTSRLEQLFNKYEQECPLFMVDECTTEGEYNNEDNCNPCLFSREHNSYRTEFEEMVSKKLVEKISLSHNRQEPINYTSFGCGDAFLETIIIAKALMHKPDACLNIHFIEGANRPYTSAADYLNVSREINTNQHMLNFGDRLNAYAQQIKNKEKLNDSVDEVQSQIVYTSLLVQKKRQQILSWLTKIFPEAKLSLSLHDIVDNYFTYLDKNNLPHADVVAAADIQDWQSIMRKSVTHYVTLCTKTLEKKPDSCNVWLAKDPRDQVSIDCIAAQKTNGARTINLNGLLVYATAQKL